MTTPGLFPEYPIQQGPARESKWPPVWSDFYVEPAAPLQPQFDGATYEPARDEKRLTGQLERVREAMANGEWWTLDRLTARVGGTTPAVSARIRDLRKPRFGAHKVERKSLGHGLFAYRVVD